MKQVYTLLGIGLAAALAVIACDNGSTDELGNGTTTKNPGSSSGTTSGDDDDTAPTAPTGPTSTGTASSDGIQGGVVQPTNTAEGKAFYKASIHPALTTKCGSCHGAAGPGPYWLTSTDAEKSYAQLFQQGYVNATSRITAKPTHGGSTTNVLATAEVQDFNKWVAMETAAGGTTKAPPNVLASLGGCFDRTKFDAMKMETWATTRRTNNNNTNKVTKWNENANNCTGCDNATCSTCHSADPATNFINAVGNPIFNDDKDYTFRETKLVTPAYITKFFGTSPDGKAVASNGLAKKSEATKKDNAYTHPMFQLNKTQQAALEAFVDDAVTKYNAGTCGKIPEAPQTK